MAASQMPIVWEFYKKVEDTHKLEGIVHYFDTTAQRLYLNQGVRTKNTIVKKGHWKNTYYESEKNLNNDNYDSMAVDQTTNKEFHMVGKIDNSLYFLRYNGKVLLDIHDYINDL